MRQRFATSALLAILPNPATADTVQDRATQENEIIVTGRRLPDKKVAPKDEYLERGISTFGALTIGEVIAKLERRNGGRPLSILIGGKRIADISDIREMPPKALAKIQVIDRSSAGNYGFSTQDDVLNLVLKPRFSAASVDTNVRQPTEGAATSTSLGLRYTRISGERRFNGGLNALNTTALYGADRQGLISAEQSDALFPFRTLLPASRSFGAVAGIALPIGAVSANLSASVSRATSRQVSRFFRFNAAQSGCHQTASVRGIVDQSSTDRQSISATASGIAGRASWSTELAGVFTSSESGTSKSSVSAIKRNPLANLALPESLQPIFARSNASTFSIAAMGNAPVWALPAGDMTANVRLAGSAEHLRASGGVNRATYSSFSQRRAQGHIGLEIPLTKSEQQIVGQMAISVGGDYERVSGLGSLLSYNVSFIWTPGQAVSLTASSTFTGSLPTLIRRQEPALYSPGVLVTDIATNRFALVTRITGGVPNLRVGSQRTNSLRATYNSKLHGVSSSVTIEYATINLDSPIISSSYPTVFFQQSFPDRFLRNSAGELVAVDARPFNGVREQRSVLRPNVHFYSGFAGEDGAWDLSISDEWSIREDLVANQRKSVINLLKTPLDGIQGSPQHRITADASASYKQLSLQLGARWRSGSTSTNVATDSADKTVFEPFVTIDAQVSYTLTRVAGKPLRLWLSVENLFNQRLSVRDRLDATPLAFQPVFSDPTGRVAVLRFSRTL